MKRLLTALVSLLAAVTTAVGATDIRDAKITRSLQLPASACTGTDAVCAASTDGLKIAAKTDGTVCVCAFITGSWQWSPIVGGGGGTTLPIFSPPSVLVYPSGANYVAVTTSDNTVLYSATDPGAAIQAGLTALAATGGVLTLKPGTYTYVATLPLIPVNLPKMLTISGYGATIKLVSASRQAFGVAKSANGDFYRNFTIEGATIDVDNIAGTGGYSVFGVKTFGTDNVDINYEDIWFRDISVINVPNATYWTAIGLDTAAVNTSDTTAMVTKGIHIDNVSTDGGCYGIRITAALSTGTPNANFDVYYDDIHVNNFRGDFSKDGTVLLWPGGVAGCTGGVHIGGHARGGMVRIENSVSKSAPDNCFEVNGMQQAVIRNADCVNPQVGGFTFANHQSNTDPATQSIVCDNCSVEYTAQPVSNSGQGWFIPVSATNKTVGQVTLRNCKYNATSFDNQFVAEAVSMIGSHDGSGGYKGLTVDNMSIFVDQNWDSTGTRILNAIRLEPDAIDWDGDGTVDLVPVMIRGLRSDVSVTKGSGSGAFTLRNIYLSGHMDLTLENFTGNATIDGASTSSDGLTGLLLGQSVGSTMQGVIKDSRWSAQGEIGQSYFINVSTNLTIPTDFLVSHVDTTNTHNTTNLGDLNLPSGYPAFFIVQNNNLRTTPAGTKSSPQPNITGVTITATESLTAPLIGFTDPDGNNPMIKRRTVNGNKRLHFTTANDTNYPFKSFWDGTNNNIHMQQIPGTDEATQAFQFYIAEWNEHVTSGAPTALYAVNASTLTTTVVAADRAANANSFFQRHDSSGNYWFANDGGIHVLDLPQATAGTLISGYADNSFPQTTSPSVRIKEANQDFYMKHIWNGGVVTTDQTITWNLPNEGCGAFGGGGLVNCTGSSGALTCTCDNDDEGSGGSGAGNTFTTIDISAGTDPVADSTVDTLTVTCTAPLICTGNSGTDTIVNTITDAIADGTTKGAATYAPADFNADGSGRISIDYANGLEGDGTLDGLISAANWTTFNGKAPPSAGYVTLAAEGGLSAESVLAVGTCLSLAGSTVSLNLGCSPAWTGTHDFTAALLAGAIPLRFDGATAGTFRTDLAVGDATGSSKTVTMTSGTYTLVGDTLSQTLTNKTMADATSFFGNTSAPTKLIKFDCSALTAGSTRTATWPDKSGTVAFTSDLTSPSSTTATAYTVDSDNAGSEPANGAGLVIDGGSGSDMSLLYDATNNEIDVSYPLNVAGAITIVGGITDTAVDGARRINLAQNVAAPSTAPAAGVMQLNAINDHFYALAPTGTATPGNVVLTGTGVSTYGPVLWAAASTSCTTVCGTGNTLSRLSACVDAYPMAGGSAVGCASTTAVRVCQCN